MESSGNWQTARLRLRRFSAADVQCVYELDNDLEVMRYINGGTPTPREIIRDEILPVFMRWDEAFALGGFWAAEEMTTGAFVGWFSLRPTYATIDSVVLGYRLRRAMWGKGYATEGVRALIERGFGEWDIGRVLATTYEENLASRRVMEKVGMRLVRRFRLTPDEIARADTSHSESIEVWDGDDVEYALERYDWEQRFTRR